MAGITGARPPLLGVIGGGPLAAAIVASLRASVPASPLIARDTVGDWEDLIGSAFIVGVVEDGATAPLHRINRFACAQGIAWLPVRVTAETARLGPTVLPGATACLLCAELRAAAHSPNPPAPFPTGEGGAVGAYSRTPTLDTLVTLEVLQTLIGEPSRARGHLGLLDRQSGGWTWHPVLRHPRCPACGSLPWQSVPPSGRPLGSIGKGGGGLGRFVDDETGIVGAVLPVPCPPNEPEPPHVALAVLSNTQFRDDWATAPPSEHTTTGKGWTVEDAQDSAIGEALERYCATLPPPPQRLIIASRAALEMPAIGPEAFGLYHPAQYADGSVPYAPVNDATVLHWVEGRALTDDRPVLVPASLVYLLPLDTFSPQTSNGLAAGRTWHEAALRALCEVIERDAFLFTWLTMCPAPLLDLIDAGESVARIARHYAERGITLTAHDLTSPASLPVVMARAHDARGRPPIDLIGLGCDPDPRRAVERAVLEVVQGRRARWDALASLGMPEAVRTPTDHALWYALTDRSAAFTFLGARPGPLPTRLGHDGQDAESLLAAAVGTLARAGHEAIIADITTPDVRAAGLSVVRALVTGLLPMHFGSGQERLGSARLADCSIATLNRTPHPLA
ncbi:MAG: TOMM precursor leader peptide-binding protein [Thermomicrobiales bacterium]